MTDFPYLRSKSKPLTQAELQQKIKEIQATLPHLHLTLYGKVLKLRQIRSVDPIQQLQSDILSEMYDVVRQTQVLLDPLLLSLPHLVVSPGP